MKSISRCLLRARCLVITFKKEPQKYTGTLVTGIAQMHKSNAVPVINKQQAIDVAKMRRG